MSEYFAIFLFCGVATIVSGAIVCLPFIVSKILGTAERTSAKISPYECGFDPIGSAPRQFNIKFYVVAILFVVFDLEIAMLFPWSLVLKDVSLISHDAGLMLFWPVMLFISVLTLGFIYEWRNGALDW